MISAAEQFRLISHGVADLLPEDEFKKKLEKSVVTNTPLIIKLGLDPTAPDISKYKVAITEEPVFIPQLLSDAGLTASNGEARRSIKAGAFKIDGEKCNEEHIVLKDGMVFQVGKRKFIKIVSC